MRIIKNKIRIIVLKIHFFLSSLMRIFFNNKIKIILLKIHVFKYINEKINPSSHYVVSRGTLKTCSWIQTSTPLSHRERGTPSAWISLIHFIVKGIVHIILHLVCQIMYSIQPINLFLQLFSKQWQARSITVNSSIVNVSKMKPYKAIHSTLLRLYGTLCILVF